MEEITMERLLTQFSEVVNEFRQLVDNKDIVGVKKALSEVEGLLANEQGIQLDRVENQPFDHVLHHFLSSIGGYIEKEEVIEGIPDRILVEIEEYRARILVLVEEKIEIQNEIRAIESQEKNYVDNSIKDRIAEIEAEIARREEAWGRTLQFTDGSEDRVAEYEKGTKKLRDELELLKKQLEVAKKEPTKKTRTEETIEVLFEDYEDTSNPEQEKQRIANELNIDPNELEITWSGADGIQSDDGPVMAYKIIRRQIKEVEVEEPVIDLSEIDVRIAELEEEIARRIEAWENTLQYTENADARKEEFEKGTEKLRAELERLKSERQTSDKSEDNSAEIERLKAAIVKAYEELELAKNGKMSPANSQWRLDLIDHIDLLKRKLAELEKAKENKDKEEPNQDLKARKKVLLERLTLIDIEINELTVKITEIEGREGKVKKDSFDVEAEVNRIGEKVFKTAEIRRELAERNVSREEFLRFYKEGLRFSETNILRLQEEKERLYNEAVEMFADKDSDKTLLEQSEEAHNNGDNLQQIAIYEKIRKKFLEHGYTEDVFQNEITTIEACYKFDAIITEYINNVEEQRCKIVAEIQEQELNKNIFRREIGIIEKELETIGMSEDEKYVIEAKASREKDLRARQIRATMFGDEELEKEYDERFERFYSHKIILTETYIDENGEEQEVEYESIENYPEYEEDAFFLNLEDYKKSLETITKYRNSGDDLYALGEDFVELLENQINKQQAIELYEKKLKQAEEYVKTFHGHTNKYKVKYENYMNAGSTLKGMIPVKDLSSLQKVGAVTENLFRFFGLRKPEFTRIDENGNEVKDVKGGVMTIATDALVVGGVVAAGVFGGPMGLAAVGTAYAAKGIVTAGNLVAGGITKAAHKDDIETNRPTPYSVSKDDREVARKDYYRNKEKLGKFRSWVKAKNDRWLFKDRARETEEKITDLEIRNANDRIDRRTVNAQIAIEANVEKANANQQKREENQRKIAQSKETYNDVIRDPDSINMEEAASIVAQNAAVRSYDREGRDINTSSKIKNTYQYVKEDPNLDKTVDLDDVVIKGGSTAATAITEEEKYTARQQKQDRMNKVATVILTVAGKVGLDFARGKFVEQLTKYEPGQDTIKKEPIFGQEKTTEMPEKLTDLKLKSESLDNIYDGDSTSLAGDVLSQGNSETMNNPVAVAIRYVTDDGKEIGVSIAEEGSGLTTTHPHIDGLLNGTLRDKSLVEVIDLFKQINPTDGSGSFAEILSQPEFAGKTTEEVVEILVKKGSLWLQNEQLGGWQNADPSKLVTTVKDVIVGYKDVVVPGNPIPYTVDVVNYKNIIDATLTGAVLGAGVATTETLHEAAHQTKKRVPGAFDIKNPIYSDGDTIMDIIERRQKALNRQREAELMEEER